MISDFKGKTAVLTGAGSGFGLECARVGARLGMNLVLVDVQQDALDAAAAEMRAAGAQVLARKVDVSSAEQMEALAVATRSQFGAPHFVFNNAGVGAGGLVWENSIRDWEWVLGVNLWGVIHGVRLFTPMMLEAAGADPNYEGHIVNTASMAGLLTPPNMGIYNVSKHAVVSLTETLYQDLKLVSDQVSASVLCPYFVPTGISQSHRNRPADLAEQKPTQSQLIGQAMSDKAVGSGKVTAAQVAQKVFDAIAADQFYIYSHPKALGNVSDRMNAIVGQHNPPDPFAERPEIGIGLKAALRAARRRGLNGLSRGSPPAALAPFRATGPQWRHELHPDPGRPDDASEADRRAAEQRYRRALNDALGDASLVLPTYRAWLGIVARHGDSPDVSALTDPERDVLELWQAAESAAITAAFGPHRYLDDAWFEIRL
jgi:NAD(P)-dependent dehydrogenase (short-subunit alcohol dehydrogenase family)